MGARDSTVLFLVGCVLSGISFFLSVLLCARAVRMRSPFGLVDFPGGDLRHRVGVPMDGGLAIYLATMIVLAVGASICVLGRSVLPEEIARYIDGLWYRAGELTVILIAATLIMIIGYATDLFQLSWKVRLAAQVVIAVGFAAFGTRVTLFWPLSYPLVGGLVTVLWVVGLTNAFTFLDNMDGLAGGVGLIAAVVFAATQAQAGSLFAPAVLLVLAGVLGGFLLFNRFPSKLFMGNSGSDFLGFLLGAMTVAGTYYRYDRNDSPNSVLSPLLVMAVPLYESLAVFLIWFRERRQTFLKNHRHFSYRLQRVGLSPTHSVRLLLLVTLGSGLGSLLLRRLDALGTAVLMGQIVCLMGVIAVVETSAIRRENTIGLAENVNPFSERAGSTSSRTES